MGLNVRLLELIDNLLRIFFLLIQTFLDSNTEEISFWFSRICFLSHELVIFCPNKLKRGQESFLNK